jgi:hypothetical protein
MNNVEEPVCPMLWVDRRANSSTLKMKDAGGMFLQNIGVNVPNYRTSQPRRQ